MNNMNNNTYRDNYDSKSVWYQLIQYLSQAEVNECARIIGTYIIEDNQTLWQELRNLQHITNMQSFSEQPISEIYIPPLVEPYLYRHGFTLNIEDFQRKPFLNDVHDIFKNEKQFLENEINQISMYDNYSSGNHTLSLSLPKNFSKTASTATSSSSGYKNNNNLLLQCRNCFTSLPSTTQLNVQTHNSGHDKKNNIKDKNRDILQTSSLVSSNFISNDNTNHDYSHLCSKCKIEMKRRDKILNGRLPSSVSHDVDLLKLVSPVSSSGYNMTFPANENRNLLSQTSIELSSFKLNSNSVVSESSTGKLSRPPTGSMSAGGTTLTGNCHSRSSTGSGDRSGRHSKIRSKLEDAKDEQFLV